MSDVFASFSVPTEIDDIYRQIEVNDLDEKLPNEFTPREYIEKKVFMNHHDPITDYPSWLAGIREWVKKKRVDDPTFPDFPPTEITTMFTAQAQANAPTIQILSPSAFSTLSGGKIDIEVKIDAPNGVDRVAFFLDERTTPNSIEHDPPYTGSIRFSSRTESGPHTITAKVYDKLHFVGEAKIEIKYEPPS